MTSADLAPSRAAVVVTALWSRQAWRATMNGLACMLVSAISTTLLGLIVIVWGATIQSLVDGPGNAGHYALYIAVVVVAPVAELLTVQGVTALQLSRLRAVAGVDIPAVPAGARASERKLWPIGPWLSASTWRQIAFHLLSAGTGLAESLARSRAEIVVATDAERRRIERDLHDGAQQRLVSLAMNLGMARERFSDVPSPANQVIAEAHEEALMALSEVREFVRGLHPAVLNDRGLDAALSGLAARAPLPVKLTVDLPRPAPPSVEAVAYFIVSEALTNVVRHSQATRAEVAVAREGDTLRIVATDNGTGGVALDDADTGVRGTGLKGLMQRAASVDGTLAIHSPPGGPTVITAELPCAS